MKIRRRDFLRGSLAAGATGAAVTLGADPVAGDSAASMPPDHAALQATTGNIVPVDLRCEYIQEPLGIDTRRPRLGWRLSAATTEARGLSQGAYQVLVATGMGSLRAGAADLWDSGRVESSEQLHVEYAGAPLASGLRCFWKIRVWDGGGLPSGWSTPSSWEMGLLAPSDWQGDWIGDGEPAPATRAAHYEDHPAPLLRRAFEVSKPVARARLYAAGLGYYELRLNGAKVSDHVLDPAWTSFDKRVPYTSHDVTALLQHGPNVLGAMLGNGWYNPLPLQMWGRINIRDHMLVGRPRLIAQLVIEHEDGTTQSVVTDDRWRVHPGPVIRNSVYLGEAFDARRQLPGWDRPGFEPVGWRPVTVQSGELGPLEAQSIAPIRITETLHPVSVTEIEPGVFIFDMGQNFAGWARLRVEGRRGTTVTMRVGELLHADGTLNPMTAVAGQIKGKNADGTPRGGAGAPLVAEHYNTYTLAGDGAEVYTPRFTFHGFRYVEVSGFPGTPGADAIEGLRLNTDVESTGSFACSDDTLNRIQEMVRWTLLSNLFSVQSDCPSREKFQYGGDIVATSEMAMLNYDFASFYAKTVRDHADAARGDGWITETAPFVGVAAENYAADAGPIGWGLAHPLLVAQLYQYYGDRRLVDEQYEVARRWVDLYEEHAVGHIIDRGLSDHESLDPKPVALTATAHYLQAARLVARLAQILGREGDQAHYELVAARIHDAFVDRFLAPGTGVFDTGTQACQATALTMGLTPAAEREAAVERMVEQVLVEHDGHVATGIFGTKYLLEELTRAGRADVALQMVQQRSFPGWGHMLDRGATTVWEHWEFSDNTYSHNHPMFGSVSEWFYKGIGGIRPCPEAVGFDRFYIEPNPVGTLRWAEARYRSARGSIVSDWRVENDELLLEIEVPVNTRAEVRLPTRDPEAVTESGGPASEADGVRSLPVARDQGARFDLGSGRYRFAAPL
ncbi:MAG TPA: family 78 glycoside hydrolase catalytic domain [Acidobacteriota bacterium]|nr:family 78 glycoside hydrolase catalytic domain [Acidobacteriota bacterium]